MTRVITVLLADDHVVVRQGLRAILEQAGFVVVAEATDGQEAVRLTEEFRPQVAILDLGMPLLNGLDAARKIVQLEPQTQIVLLTVHTEDQYILEALHAGVRGYVVKTQASEDLVHAVREAARGGVYLSPAASQIVVDAFLKGEGVAVDPLTPREREVLQLVAEGHTTKQIAVALGISVKTAESHRGRIMEKLNIHETAGLVRYAIRRGLVRA